MILTVVEMHYTYELFNTAKVRYLRLVPLHTSLLNKCLSFVC